MAAEQHHAWLDFSACIDNELIAEWEQLSTEPMLVDGKWTSVFMLPETPGEPSGTLWNV